ncbi:MAG: hypothetical protein IPL88_07265 [Rhizobiales bacterium]|nr:hypothetical protein [Hyphomicrobiales bacterium]
MRSVVAAAAFSLVMALAPLAARAACEHSPVRFQPNGRERVSMVVTRDSACTIFATSSLTANMGGISSYVGTTVARRPAHGVAGVASKHEWGYKPNPGYAGRDSFAMEMRFTRMNSTQVERMTVDIDVTVR